MFDFALLGLVHTNLAIRFAIARRKIKPAIDEENSSNKHIARTNGFSKYQFPDYKGVDMRDEGAFGSRTECEVLT